VGHPHHAALGPDRESSAGRGPIIAAERIERNLADYWADQMTEIAEKDPKSLILVIADMARSNPPLVSSFVAEFYRQLQGQGPLWHLPLTWIEQRLSESGLTIEQLVRAENQTTGCRPGLDEQQHRQPPFPGRDGLARVRRDDEHCRADPVEDPGDVYGKMDFTTRDRYRHVVEKWLQKQPSLRERGGAQAIRLAHAGAARKGGDDRTAHVGFYLIGEGLAQLERMVKVRLSSAEVSYAKPAAGFRCFCMAALILLMTAIFAGSFAAKTYMPTDYQGLGTALIGLLLLLCASHLAVALVNWLATLLATPHPLPRMDFSKGIPSESRTLVVVPTMLTASQNIE
jgi:cyclic beta-1,2-glucan synthetase